MKSESDDHCHQEFLYGNGHANRGQNRGLCDKIHINHAQMQITSGQQPIFFPNVNTLTIRTSNEQYLINPRKSASSVCSMVHRCRSPWGQPERQQVVTHRFRENLFESV